MDFTALQHKLFALDPSDRAEDLRKLKESAGATDNVAPTKDYVVESVNVAQGSMLVEGDYSLADFAALAGVTLTEAQKKGSVRYTCLYIIYISTYIYVYRWCACLYICA